MVGGILKAGRSESAELGTHRILKSILSALKAPWLRLGLPAAGLVWVAAETGSTRALNRKF